MHSSAVLRIKCELKATSGATNSHGAISRNVKFSYIEFPPTCLPCALEEISLLLMLPNLCLWNLFAGFDVQYKDSTHSSYLKLDLTQQRSSSSLAPLFNNTSSYPIILTVTMHDNSLENVLFHCVAAALQILMQFIISSSLAAQSVAIPTFCMVQIYESPTTKCWGDITNPFSQINWKDEWIKLINTLTSSTERATSLFMSNWRLTTQQAHGCHSNWLTGGQELLKMFPMSPLEFSLAL